MKEKREILEKLEAAYKELKGAGYIHRKDVLKHIYRLTKQLKSINMK